MNQNWAALGIPAIKCRLVLEGETSSDQIDEQYLYVSGNFGRIEMGKNDSAADSMQIVAPAVGPVGVNDGDLDIWVNSYLIDTTIPEPRDLLHAEPWWLPCGRFVCR